jgi:predicted  nucleic acid-binding Zn-ribbon protein
MNMTDEFTKDMDAKYDDELNGLRFAIKLLQKQLAAKEQQITDLKANHKNDVAYETELRAALASKDKEIASLKADWNKTVDKLVEKQNELLASRKENSDLKAKIARTITWVEINSPASAGMVRKILRGEG